jgi:Domain of unknown function (DUF4926)
LIHLSRIGRAELLRQLYGEILIPNAVAEEVARHPAVVLEAGFASGWLTRVVPSNHARVDQIERDLGGRGETELIGVCQVCDGLSGGGRMTYHLLDTIVLNRDLPEQALCRGDLGAVVEVYEPDGLEVEFVTASGRTAALLTLNERDVRPVADDDLVAVRPCRRVG